METLFTVSMTNAATEEVVADFGNRKLIRFTCSCGLTVENCLRAEQPRICLDCRADSDRAVNGWTPENSLS